MSIEIEITEGGMLKVKSPELPIGSTITLPTANKEVVEPIKGNGNWESIKPGLDEVKNLDIPRRSQKEILDDLH